ncbi:MAG: Uma2 family endonuclease [Chloroflexi bacterium]|nr:Uma2 family endonuclease [Chloroflexota bacterium]
MVTTTKLVTADELMEMPDDGFRYELVRGDLIQMAPAGHMSSFHEMQVGAMLHNFVKSNELGRVYSSSGGFRLESNPDTVLAPDASFVRQERVEAAGDTDGYFPGAPDLVIEVISPSDRYTEVEAKVAEWLNAGARMVVVVNPRNRTVRVHHSPTEAVLLTEADTLDGGDVVPGWRLPVADIFA